MVKPAHDILMTITLVGLILLPHNHRFAEEVLLESFFELGPLKSAADIEKV
jgi:hypothetical protein